MGAKMSVPLVEHEAHDVPISEAELRALLLEYRRANWNGIQPAQIQAHIVEDLIHSNCETVLAQIAPYLKLTSETRILDVGSGVGSFVVSCRNRGYSAVGIEPDKIGRGADLTSIQIARRRLSAPVFANAVGEQLPFPDASFDLVTLNQVVEHVREQRAVLCEAARVVREGGVIYVACPNYLAFFEPHYKILWLPLMPKSLGRLYLRLRGRSPAMLEQLTYTTNRRLRNLCASFGPAYTVLDLHREAFLRKRLLGSFAARSTRLANRLTRVPLVGPLILQAILKYGSIREGACEIVIIRKPGTASHC